MSLWYLSAVCRYTTPGRESGRLLRHLCFSSSFLRLFNPGGSGHVQGARAHRAQRGLPLTWPRQDYIARLEEEEKHRSNRQPRAAARGRPPSWCPAATAGGQGKEHAPAPGARPHTAQQSKTNRPTAERSDLRGVGGHAAPTRSARLRPRRVRHTRAPPVPRHAQGLQSRSASTEARLARPMVLAGGQTAAALLLVRAAEDAGLDAGALRQYIAKPGKERESPQRDSGRSGEAAYLQERQAIREAPGGGVGGERK